VARDVGAGIPKSAAPSDVASALGPSSIMSLRVSGLYLPDSPSTLSYPDSERGEPKLPTCAQNVQITRTTNSKVNIS
jgi:hypothetical protein